MMFWTRWPGSHSSKPVELEITADSLDPDNLVFKDTTGRFLIIRPQSRSEWEKLKDTVETGYRYYVENT